MLTFGGKAPKKVLLGLMLRESNEINLEMWPVTQNVNEDIDLSFDDAVNRMKEAYRERITELDKVISNY